MDLEISAQHTEVHPRWREMIERHLAKLNGQATRMVRMHVTLVHSTHHLRGNEEVRILASLPGHTLRVQKARANMGDAIHAAFAALQRELESDIAHRRSPTREYGPRFSGVISQLFAARGYGFIRTPEEQEIYFHRDALHNLSFADLHEGLAVEFDVEHGTKGPQAARVYPPGH
jgi:cold shock CspA family protein/ribosome-associated translation inhibitor RaiA